MTGHRLFPYLLIIVAGFIWGATFSLALIATADGAHALTLTAWQVALTAGFFLCVCLASGVRLLERHNLRHYGVLALIGITLPDVFYYLAAPHLSAGILAITVSAVPLFTYAIMLLLRFESLIARRFAGIVLGMTAILLLVLPDQGLDSGDASLWILLVVLCALCYAIENIYIGRGIPHHVDIRELLFASNLLAMLVLFPLTIRLGIDEPLDWLVTDAGLALAAIAIGNGIAYLMFFYSIKSAGPVFASQCAYVVTLSGVIWGIIVFSEQHTAWVWAAVIVMLLGLVLVNPDEGDSADELEKPAAAESSG